mgnify:CR=1 FL=1
MPSCIFQHIAMLSCNFQHSYVDIAEGVVTEDASGGGRRTGPKPETTAVSVSWSRGFWCTGEQPVFESYSGHLEDVNPAALGFKVGESAVSYGRSYCCYLPGSGLKVTHHFGITPRACLQPLCQPGSTARMPNAHPPNAHPRPGAPPPPAGVQGYPHRRHHSGPGSDLRPRVRPRLRQARPRRRQPRRAASASARAVRAHLRHRRHSPGRQLPLRHTAPSRQVRQGLRISWPRVLVVPRATWHTPGCGLCRVRQQGLVLRPPGSATPCKAQPQSRTHAAQLVSSPLPPPVLVVSRGDPRLRAVPCSSPLGFLPRPPTARFLSSAPPMLPARQHPITTLPCRAPSPRAAPLPPPRLPPLLCPVLQVHLQHHTPRRHPLPLLQPRSRLPLRLRRHCVSELCAGHPCSQRPRGGGAPAAHPQHSVWRCLGVAGLQL